MNNTEHPRLQKVDWLMVPTFILLLPLFIIGAFVLLGQWITGKEDKIE